MSSMILWDFQMINNHTGLDGLKTFLINNCLFKPYSWDEIELYNSFIEERAMMAKNTIKQMIRTWHVEIPSAHLLNSEIDKVFATQFHGNKNKGGAE